MCSVQNNYGVNRPLRDSVMFDSLSRPTLVDPQPDIIRRFYRYKRSGHVKGPQKD